MSGKMGFSYRFSLRLQRVSVVPPHFFESILHWYTWCCN